MNRQHSTVTASTTQVTLLFSDSTAVGAYFFSVPNEQMDAFKELVAKYGGHLDLETSERLHYVFHGEDSSATASNLAVQHMFKH